MAERGPLRVGVVLSTREWWRRLHAYATDHSADVQVVVVRDEWDLVAGPGRTLLHLVVAGEVTLGEGSATIAGLSGALRLDWEPAVPCALIVRELDDPQLSDVWGARLLRMDLDVTALGPIGSLDLRVKEQRL